MAGGAVRGDQELTSSLLDSPGVCVSPGGSHLLEALPEAQLSEWGWPAPGTRSHLCGNGGRRCFLETFQDPKDGGSFPQEEMFPGNSVTQKSF